jgi:hypothetical protein
VHLGTLDQADRKTGVVPRAEETALPAGEHRQEMAKKLEAAPRRSSSPICYDDDCNRRRCPNRPEHVIPNGTEHPTLLPSSVCVFDGRLGIQPTSITKNGDHSWQVNVCQGSEIISIGQHQE